jgi:hypothetical protein
MEFDPSIGTGLTPEMGQVTVTVQVTAPDQQNTVFTGRVKVVNTDNSNDYCYIDAYLKTPLSQNSMNLKTLQLLKRDVQQHFLFLMLLGF